ncbi:MAG: AAA family ATPase [Promethearchaeota archaeon]
MIKNIWLRNFRRFKDEKISFTKGLNILEGNNNVGKTTIFYAMEYCLFGNVTGFKTPSELMSPNKKMMGVQMEFKGRKDGIYRLQRIHEIPPQSKKKVIGHFTLKEINENNDEKYLCSSDFQDREEDLARKIFDLTGITKRLFETSILFRQGEISSILKGTSKLDIVLGVTAAVIADEELRSMALEKEKEISSLPILEESLNKLKTDQSQIEEDVIKVQDELKEITEKYKVLQTIRESISEAENLKSNLIKAKNQFETNVRSWESDVERLKAIQIELEEFISTNGSKEALESRLKQISQENIQFQQTIEQCTITINNHHKIMNKLNETRGALKGQLSRNISLLSIEIPTKKLPLHETVLSRIDETKDIDPQLEQLIQDSQKEITSIQTEINKKNESRGDLSGRLTRRSSLLKGENARCETCGQIIDQNQVKMEISDWKKQLKKLDGELKSLSEQKKDFEKRIDRFKESKLKNEINSFLDRLIDIETELQATSDQLEDEEKKKTELLNKQKSLLISITDIKSKLKQYNTYSKKITDIIAEIEELESNIVTTHETLLHEIQVYFTRFQEFNLNHSNLFPDLQIKEFDFSEIKPKPISKYKVSTEILEKVESLTLLSEEFHRLENAYNVVIIKADNDIENAQSTKSRIEEDNNKLKKRLNNVRKEIARINKEVDNLYYKKESAKKYRQVSKGFKELQHHLREHATSTLASDTLQMHDKLSGITDEYQTLSIDPKRYVINVKPIDIGREVPAHACQGGGHQLLLGLAFKFAIARMAGSTNFLLLDEPTYGLDIQHRKELLSKMDNLNITNQLFLITHQNTGTVKGNRIKIIRDGKYSKQMIETS